jgi:hypothetical protein
METIFPYRREHSKLFGKIYRPVVQVELKWRSERTIQRMYLDSGADISLIPMSVGDSLGLEITDDIKEMKGVGNVIIPVIIKNINIRLCDKEFTARFAWSLIEEVPLLLGRMDIFDKFEIIFMQKEKNVVLYSKD